MDLDKLSDTAYGNLLIATLVIIALLFNIFPFNLFGLIISVLQIFIFLQIRFKLDKPIHAVGLNKCYFFTTSFYILLFFMIRFLSYIVSLELTFMICTTITYLSCYSTSEHSTIKGDLGKVFWGKRKVESEYQQIYTWVRYNQNDSRIIDFQENLKRDNLLYTIFMEIFINKTSLNKMADILNFKQDTSVLPYVNRIVGKLSDTIYEVNLICREHQTDAKIKD